MATNKKRTTKKTRNIAAFRQKILQQTPPHIIHKQLIATMPWITTLPGDERDDCLNELTGLTISAAGGNVADALNLQKATDYWQQVAGLEPKTS